jgi:hypothetical protein
MLGCARSNLAATATGGWIYAIKANALAAVGMATSRRLSSTDSCPLVLLLYRPSYKSGD